MMGTEAWKCSPPTAGAGDATGSMLVPFVSAPPSDSA
jgi:hypothetical protein